MNNGNHEPKTFLIRKRQLQEWTGLSDSLLSKMIRNGVIHPVKLWEGGRRYYRRDEIKRVLENYGKPQDNEEPLVRINKELQEAIANGGFFIEVGQHAYETRRCIWPGQSNDGKKKAAQLGYDPFPWEGASDVRIRLADEIINDEVRIANAGLNRSVMQAVPVESGDAREAGAISIFLKHMVGTRMAEDCATETKLLGNWMNTYGVAVMAVTWDIETRIFRKDVDLSTVAQMEAQLEGGDPADLLAAIKDPTREDEVVNWLVGRVEMLKEKQARKITRDLREKGEATLPIPKVVKNQAKWTACRVFRDVFFPENTTELRSARWIAYRECLSEADLRKRALVDGWDEDEVERVIRDCQGKTVLDAARYGELTVANVAGIVDEMKYLYEIVTFYEREADEDGHITCYATVFSPLAKDPLTEYEVGYQHNEYHFHEFIRNRTERIILENRGIPEIADTHQLEIKTQRDYRRDRAAIAINPPVRVPAGRVTKDLLFGPGVKIPERVKGEHDWMQPPPIDRDTVLVEEQTKKDIDSYFARFVEGVDPNRAMLYSQDNIENWLAGFRKVMRQTLSLCRQYVSDEDFLRITGVPMSFNRSESDMIEEWDVTMEFNARDLNLDMVIQKLDVINKAILPADTMGVVDRAGVIQWAMRAIDPALAEHVVQNPQAASNQEIEDENNNWLKILNGVEPEMKTGQNYGLRKQVLMQRAQENPENQQKLAASEINSEIFKQQVQHLDFQVEQQQNAQIGRLGAAPVLGGNGSEI